jgi:hypothetical protein
MFDMPLGEKMGDFLTARTYGTSKSFVWSSKVQYKVVVKIS